jgi:type IV pilus assembly protein PilQ
MIRPTLQALAAVAISIALCGCTTTRRPAAGATAAPAPELAKAEALLQKGDATAAMIACIDLARVDPDMPGLEDLQHKVLTKLEEERAARAAVRSSMVSQRMGTDLMRHKDIPDTYGLRRSTNGAAGSLRTPEKAMQKALQKKVTLHLDNVDLANFILTLGDSEKINIVADNLTSDKTVTIHAQETPLSEILDYVARNMGIAFYLGDNIIWATPQEQSKQGLPMEIRMYRLRKGIDGSLSAAGNGNAAASDAENIKIVQAIQRFVPQPEGSDLLFDDRSHALIVKNTVENLAKVEDLIETLDVCPPQTLIEARFISTDVTDLRELGIDWILKDPLRVSESFHRNQTQINAGNVVEFSPLANAAKGLNLTYEGVLTDPKFQAVLHALEKTGKSQTLSVPKVTTVNNRIATIRVGEDFRYYDEYNVQSTPSQVVGTGGNTVYSSILVPVGSPKLEQLGIELKVRPSVGADMSSITLQLLPEISEFVRYEFYEVGNGNNNQNNAATNGTSVVKLPIFRRSRIETEVIVQSGETVVMGGLITSAESKKKDRVPVLSYLPLIGLLFQNDVVDNTQKNLLIFVTATLISERGENLIPLAPARPAAATPAPAPAAAVTKDK